MELMAVLGILDQEYHQKSDNRCTSVDNQLPGVREVENRPGDKPNSY